MEQKAVSNDLVPLKAAAELVQEILGHRYAKSYLWIKENLHRSNSKGGEYNREQNYYGFVSKQDLLRAIQFELNEEQIAHTNKTQAFIKAKQILVGSGGSGLSPLPHTYYRGGEGAR